jgi:hypothetical protein
MMIKYFKIWVIGLHLYSCPDLSIYGQYCAGMTGAMVRICPTLPEVQFYKEIKAQEH